ncbi:hypothetical protein ABK040_006822 [Willaertia magna]
MSKQTTSMILEQTYNSKQAFNKEEYEKRMKAINDKTNQTLNTCEALLNEIEETGIETLKTTKQQSEQLKTINKQLNEDIKQDLDESNSILKRMSSWWRF